MPTDACLAAVHFRVQMAGQALEFAAAFLQGRRVFQGLTQIRQAAAHLQHASAHLKSSGQYPDLARFVDGLVAFYNAEIPKLVRPMSAPAVATEVFNNQANLLLADPVLNPGVAH